jgi:hypothetical protein
MDLRQVAAMLGGVVSKDRVLAPGPGHSPADRSLSVKLSTDAPDGFIVHSFAGDDPILCRDYVREKCGPAFKANGNGRRRPSSAEIEKLLASAIDYQQPKVAAKYRYVSQDGKTTLYEVVKYDPKGFAQRRPNGKGGWIWNLDGQQRVIYRWPYVAQNPGTVFITEGEKDADRVIEQLGYAATTVASGKWTEDCVEALRGRDCWVLEDIAGRKKALDAAQNLFGTAASIRIIRLPDLGERGDISDWLDAGHSAEEFEGVCYRTPEWTPDAIGEEKNEPAASAEAPEAKPPPPTSPWSYHGENATVATRWLIKNVLPETGTALIAGQWGSYKSTVALDLAVSVMTGTPFAGRFKVKR